MRRLQQREKVFGIGLSKTGTSSLTQALNILGIRSIHFPHDEQTFAELKRGEYRLSVLRDYQSATDTPVSPFYAQLDRAWPGSKFILTVRDKASWLRSAEAHWRVLKEGPRANEQQFQAYVDFISACVYGCSYFNAERFSFAYDTHVKNVREYFAGRPDDFLLLDIVGGEGWGPLCDFLEVPVPEDRSFPHAYRANQWRHLLLQATRDLAMTIPASETLILVDQDGLGSGVAPGSVLPFPEQDGEYGGLPADSETAIAAVERLRVERGAAFLAVAWPAFWWLEYYTGFAAHLGATFPRVLENDRVIVFDLRRRM